MVDGDDEDGDNGDYIVDIDDDDADVDSYVVDNVDGDDDDCNGAKISKSGKRRKSFFCNNFFKIVQKLIL